MNKPAALHARSITGRRMVVSLKLTVALGSKGFTAALRVIMRVLQTGFTPSVSTHWARHAGASKGSAKYCVSCTTLPSRNSMMLTV